MAGGGESHGLSKGLELDSCGGAGVCSGVRDAGRIFCMETQERRKPQLCV